MIMMDMETSLMMRHFRHPPLDTGGPLSKRQILFSNWLLLGLDVPTLEHKYSKPFNRDMFNLPNKAGAEAILHFLFNRLNPVMCKEEFRDCWPVQDKKTEALFSRVCNKWLRNIQKDEPDSRLPRINASLFLSPYGEKFYQLLFRFTNFVMQQTIKRECEVRSRDMMSCPQLSPHNAHLGEVMYDIQKCGVVQRRQKFLERIERSIAVSETWKSTASDLVRENRRLSKSIRDLEHHLRNEEQMSHEKRVASRSPSSKKHPLGFEHEVTSHQIKRTHRVQKVRDKWKKLDGFCNMDAPERQIIESLLDKALHKYEIDAADIPVKVPGLLLRECENEIYKRHVDNTYQGGKLNILSLVQLWNLSLHLYIERFHQVGLPDLEMESRRLREAVHTNQAQTSNATSFQKMLREELMPLLKQSVGRLRERLDADENNSNTPQSGRTMSVGLGLFSSTPPISFTPQDEDDVPTKSLLHITPHQHAVMTPEAAESIASTVAQSSRKVAKTLFQGTPVYAPRLAMQGKLPRSERHDTSRIPLKEKHKSVVINSNISSSPWRRDHKMDAEASIHERDALSTSIPLEDVCDMSSNQITPRSLRKTPVHNNYVSDVVSSTRSSSTSHSRMPTTSQLLQDSHMREESEARGGDTQDGGMVKKTRSSVDDYVDEIVAQVLDDSQDEDRSLEDAFSSLHSKSRSPTCTIFLPSRSVVLDEDDLNNSRVSDEENTTLVKNRSYLSKSTLKEDVDKIVSRVGNLLDIVDERTRNIQDDLGQMTASELTDDKSMFVHTDKLRQELRESDASVKFERKADDATSRIDARRNSVQQDSQMGRFVHPDIPGGFVHPDIPNVDFAKPGHSSRGTPDPQKHRHSVVGANLLSEEGARVIAEWTNSGRSMSLDMRSGVDDMRHSLGSWATRQVPRKSPIANIPEPTDSSILSDDISHPQQTVIPSPRKSPDAKVGTPLTTEIRRMWRESLDDDEDTSEKKLPLTSPRGTTPKTSMTSKSFTVSSSERDLAKPYSFMEFSPDSKFTALEDVSADVLLSPDMWDDFPTEYDVLHSSGVCGKSQLDDPVNSKNPHLENIGIVESLAARSPSLPSEHVLPQTYPNPNPTTPYADDSKSPNLTRSLPGFSHRDDPRSSIPEQRLHAESAWLASVFDNLDLELEKDVEDARAELLVSLDDSFVPLQDGLQLEGKSPARPLQLTSDVHPHSHSNLFASFQRMNATQQPLHGTLEPQGNLEHEEQLDKDLMQSTSSAEERLMSVLEEKYVTGVNTSWSLLDDEQLEDINLLVES